MTKAQQLGEAAVEDSSVIPPFEEERWSRDEIEVMAKDAALSSFEYEHHVDCHFPEVR
jgi:hypothetical protein